MISRPLIVLGAPRSGTTFVFQAFSAHPDLWSLYRGSQSVINRHFPVEMVPGGSALVRRADVDEATARAMEREFFEGVGNAETVLGGLGRLLPHVARVRTSRVMTRLGGHRKVAPIRIVEKTLDNCFRIQMLLRVFPDALFLHVVRAPRESIASLYRGWTQEAAFPRYRLPPGFTVKGYDGGAWCFSLPPGWEQLDGGTVMELCAHQWRSSNEYCHRDLPSDPARVRQVRYEELVADARAVVGEAAAWAGLDPGPLRRPGAMPGSVSTWAEPSPDTCRRIGGELDEVLPSVGAEAARLGYRTG